MGFEIGRRNSANASTLRPRCRIVKKNPRWADRTERFAMGYVAYLGFAIRTPIVSNGEKSPSHSKWLE